MRALSARFMQLERGEVTHRPISDTRFVERLSNASCSATSFVDPNEHFSHTPIFWVFCLHLTRPCCLHGGNMQHRWRRRCSEPAVLCSTCAMLTNMLTFASLFCRRIYFSRSLSSCSLGFYIQQTMFNISACSSTSSEAPVCHIPHADLWLGTLAKLLHPPSKGWSVFATSANLSDWRWVTNLFLARPYLVQITQITSAFGEARMVMRIYFGTRPYVVRTII